MLYNVTIHNDILFYTQSFDKAKSFVDKYNLVNSPEHPAEIKTIPLDESLEQRVDCIIDSYKEYYIAIFRSANGVIRLSQVISKFSSQQFDTVYTYKDYVEVHLAIDSLDELNDPKLNDRLNFLLK